MSRRTIRLATAVAAAAAGQRLTERWFTGRSSPPGQIVDVSGEPVHVRLAGPVSTNSGPPAVVFANGLAGASFDWDAVVRSLGPRITTVRFDRPGLGWSPGPSRIADGVLESERVLGVARSAGVSSPFVVVGWSYGGFIAQVTARRHPELVAAVVLVDSSCIAQREARRSGAPAWRERGVRAAVRVVVEAGAGVPLALGGRRMSMRLHTHHAGEQADRRERLATYGTRRAALAAVDELLGYDRIEADLAELERRGPFPPIPLRVVTGSASRRPGGAAAARWRGQQRELLQLTPTARLVEIIDASHAVLADRPDAVAAAIEDVISAIR